MGAKAGAIAGAAGCLVFLVLHALWIVPIWFVAPVGFGIAAGAGAALGTLLDRLAPIHRPEAVRAAVAFAAATVVLAPSMVAAELGFDADSGPLVALAGFFLPVVAVGAGLGWLADRPRGGMRRGVLAAILIAIGPGHNIPFLAGTSAVPMEVAILACVLAVASVTLVIAQRLLARGAALQSVGEPTR